MARTKKRAIYALVESTFSTDPDTDGSDYLSIPAYVVGDLKDELQLLVTDYQMGRDRSTTPQVGPDGASFDFETPYIGYGDALGAGEMSPAADWFDTLLLHFFGSTSVVAGVAISGTSATTVSGGTDVFNTGDVCSVWEAGYPSTAAERSFVQLVQNDTSPWTVAPGFPDAGPGAAGAVAYGSRMYRPDDDGGATLSFVYVEDDVQYTLTGCRITSFKIRGDAGKEVRCMFSVRVDTKAITTKASLPAALTEPARQPVRLAMSPVHLGTTNLGHVGSVEIDFTPNTATLDSTNGNANGRAGDELINVRPTVTINPPADSTRSHFTLKRVQTEGAVMIQLGRGQLTTGVLNSGAVCFPLGSAREVTLEDENGRLRNSVKIQADDAGASYGYCIVARF